MQAVLFYNIYGVEFAYAYSFEWLKVIPCIANAILSQSLSHKISNLNLPIAAQIATEHVTLSLKEQQTVISLWYLS